MTIFNINDDTNIQVKIGRIKCQLYGFQKQESKCLKKEEEDICKAMNKETEEKTGKKH